MRRLQIVKNLSTPDQQFCIEWIPHWLSFLGLDLLAVIRLPSLFLSVIPSLYSFTLSLNICWAPRPVLGIIDVDITISPNAATTANIQTPLQWEWLASVPPDNYHLNACFHKWSREHEDRGYTLCSHHLPICHIRICQEVNKFVCF